MKSLMQLFRHQLKVEDRAPGKRPGGSKLRRCNSESSKEQPENGLKDFDGEEHPTLTFMHPESRSKAEETQPNLKEEVHRRGDVLDSLDGSAGKVCSAFFVPSALGCVVFELSACLCWARW